MVLRLLILTIALGAAGGAAWLTLSIDAQKKAEQQAAVVEVPNKDVLVAVQAISGGEVLSPDKVRWQPMPETAVNDQFITRQARPEAITALSGSFVNRAFNAGEPIRAERLMETNINLMSNKIAPGKRAAAVRITAENTAGGFILPGDRVDVIHTTTRPGASGQPAINESAIIISNVRVLAIDQTAVQSPEGSAIGKTATLELSPEEAERIMAAEASGLLSLALRAVTDHAETLQEVLVVVEPLDAGDRLAADKLRWALISKPKMNDQYIRRSDTPDAIEAHAGAYVDRAFAAGEPLVASRIQIINRNLMSNRLRDGKRATAVKVSAEATAGGFILPGDRVDVIHTASTVEEGDTAATNRSEVIVLNAVVLAIDQTSEQTAEGSAIGKTATLELKPEEAERVLVAEASGTLSLALRPTSEHDAHVVDVLVAGEDMAEGQALTPARLRWRPMDAEKIPDTYVRRDTNPDAADALNGFFVDRAFGAGEPLRTDRLLRTNANLMAYRLQPGMRAAAVKISAEASAGGFILPGDRADVIHTIAIPETESDPAKNESQIIIQNVKVLAIDQSAVQTAEGAVVGQTATLELEPEDAERIMAAEASGTLSLALRAADDHRVVQAPASQPKPHTVRVHRGAETQTVTLR